MSPPPPPPPPAAHAGEPDTIFSTSPFVALFAKRVGEPPDPPTIKSPAVVIGFVNPVPPGLNSDIKENAGFIRKSD